MRYLFGFMCALALGVMGCSDSGGTPDPSPYADKDLWLCRPDIEDDHCDTADLSTTEIQTDGTMVVLDEVAPNPDAEVDCFYVYHTVNTSPEPGNTETLVPHPEEVVAAVLRNGAHYRGVCRMFAPLYRQMSLITYTAFPLQWQETEFFQKAYDDVVAAFDYYMRNHNSNRDIVFIGHSQGSNLLAKLMQEKFDGDDTLRNRLLSAMLIGPSGFVQVLEGELVGGTYANIPLCTSATETGCVVSFDAIATGIPGRPSFATIPWPPMARACVNPASLNDGSGALAALIYPRNNTKLMAPFWPDGIDTEWVRYPNIYTAGCSEDSPHMLQIDLANEYDGEVPVTPQEIQQYAFELGSVPNLHGGEFYLANTDLVRIVEQQIASRGN